MGHSGAKNSAKNTDGSSANAVSNEQDGNYKKIAPLRTLIFKGIPLQGRLRIGEKLAN
jgi:hypothetical protein